jgi:hypothetical protein
VDFNIILPSTLRWSKWSLLFAFTNYNSKSISDGLHLRYICRVANSVSLRTCPSIHPAVLPPFRPFFRPPIRPTIHPPLKTSTCQTFYPSTHLSNHKSIHPPTYLCACTSVCPYIYPPAHLFPVLARTFIVFRHPPSFLACPLHYHYCCRRSSISYKSLQVQLFSFLLYLRFRLHHLFVFIFFLNFVHIRFSSRPSQTSVLLVSNFLFFFLQ